jgi:hypothetical protein
MHPNVIDTDGSAAIGESYHRALRHRIEADEATVPAGAAIVPDDLFAARLGDVPAERNRKIRAVGRAPHAQHARERSRERRLHLTARRGKKHR